MKINAPRGTHDVLPEDSYKWRYIEGKLHEVCERFGYKEMRTPVFEHTELFERGVGETTDIVQKEMYTFNDKGGRSITLRPEGTAGAVRSYIENNLYAGPQPVKVYYKTSCYRHEKPQAGRLREFHQFGVEVFGAKAPSIDAEIISLAIQYLESLGVLKIKLHINSAGCPACRAEYNKKLKAFLAGKDLCGTCAGRLDKNPLRILDCKSEHCQGLVGDAPKIIDHLCEYCQGHFDLVRKHLDSCDIDYVVDSGIVRGLDYYTQTVFEIISNDIGAQGTVCGGGRYDGMVAELGGPETPAIGFGLGLERLLMMMENLGIDILEPVPTSLYIASIGEQADVLASRIVGDLRKKGVSAERNHINRSVKAQMKYADKIGAQKVIVIGDDEIKSGLGKIKDMETGEEREVRLDEIEMNG